MAIDGAQLHVVFKVGGAEYAMAAADIVQMESFQGATPVPGTSPHVAGVVQLRGRVLPVVDLRARFGLPPAERTLDSRIVVGQDGARAVALLVDCAREIVKLDGGQIEPPPPAVAEDSQGFVKAIARIGPRLIMLIDFHRVIGEEVLHGD